MAELNQVGFLIPKGKGHIVICLDCAEGHPNHDRMTPIFRINIYPYKQTCYECKKVLVIPATPKWPELFEGDK